MSEDQKPLSRSATIAVGVIGAAAGLFLILESAGLVRLPGGPSATKDGPLWILACAGVAFMLGGICVLLYTAAGGDGSRELPPSAPRWIGVAQYFMALTMIGCLGAIGTWVAFGGGARSFSISGPLFETTSGSELIGRAVFGIGAVLTWLCLIAFAIGGARKLFGRGRV